MILETINTPNSNISIVDSNTWVTITDIAYGGVGDGVTDNTNAFIAAMNAATDKIFLPSGDYLVTSFSNPKGIEFYGSGRILINITGGTKKLNSESDNGQWITGKEYLSHFHKRIISGAAKKIVCSGDSTTLGNNLTAPYIPSTLLVTMASKYGITGVTGVNSGHGGKSSSDWISGGLNYVGSDLAQVPDLYIIRWGINDPYVLTSNLTPTQSINNIRNGLATCRASYSVANMSIILMMPNSTNDTAGNRDERFYEAIRIGYKQAARDYQAVFFDTYSMFRDSYNSSDWMDAPYGDNRHIHPADVMSAWICSALADIIYPTALRSNG